MASSSKRQTTMAKIAREQAVRERRVRKAEKKELKKQAAAPDDGAGLEPQGDDAEGQASAPVE
jgi:hypothetical protein